MGAHSLEGSAARGRTALALWFAKGDQEAYQAFNVTVERGLRAVSVHASLGCTRVEFPEAGESDNEFFGGVALHGRPWITPVLDYTYSTEAEAGFLELSLQSEMAVFEDRLVIEPYVLEGFDFGYASEANDGSSHLQIGFDLRWRLPEQLHGGHPWPTVGRTMTCEMTALATYPWVNAGLSAGF